VGSHAFAKARLVPHQNALGELHDKEARMTENDRSGGAIKGGGSQHQYNGEACRRRPLAGPVYFKRRRRRGLHSAFTLPRIPVMLNPGLLEAGFEMRWRCAALNSDVGTGRLIFHVQHMFNRFRKWLRGGVEQIQCGVWSAREKFVYGGDVWLASELESSILTCQFTTP